MLDLDALKKIQTGLESSGPQNVFRPSQLKDGEQVFFLLMPPLPEQGGIPFVCVETWWVNKKPYTFNVDTVQNDSKDIFGKMRDAVLADENLSELHPLLSTEGLDSPVRKSVQYHYPIIRLKRKEEGSRELIPVKDEPEILQVGKTIHQAIVGLLVSPDYAEDIISRKDGRPLVINRAGTGLGTKYNTVPHPKTVDFSGEDFDELYQDQPDVKTEAAKWSKDGQYMEGLFNHYVHGQEAPEENKTGKTKKPSPKKTKKTEGSDDSDDVGSLVDEL